MPDPEPPVAYARLEMDQPVRLPLPEAADHVDLKVLAVWDAEKGRPQRVLVGRWLWADDVTPIEAPETPE